MWHSFLCHILCQISSFSRTLSPSSFLSWKLGSKPLKLIWTKCHGASCIFFLFFHRAMLKFRGYLRRLIIRAEEGFHGWAGIYICLLWSMLPFYSKWGQPLLAWKSGDSRKRTRKLCCARGLFSWVTSSTNDLNWIQFSVRPQWECTFVLL